MLWNLDYDGNQLWCLGEYQISFLVGIGCVVRWCILVFGGTAPSCLMWTVWRERNLRNFEGQEWLIIQLKSSCAIPFWVAACLFLCCWCRLRHTSISAELVFFLISFYFLFLLSVLSIIHVYLGPGLFLFHQRTYFVLIPK